MGYNKKYYKRVELQSPAFLLRENLHAKTLFTGFD